MANERTAGADDDRSVDGTRYYVADAEELDPGERIVVDIEGREVGVFNVDGEYYALLNYCVHQGAPLCEGGTSGVLTEDLERGLQYEREGEIITCPWHAWEFDITNGEHLARPSDYRIPTYDVVVRDAKVYVVL